MLTSEQEQEQKAGANILFLYAMTSDLVDLDLEAENLGSSFVSTL
jgi:hypothetical protein